MKEYEIGYAYVEWSSGRARVGIPDNWIPIDREMHNGNISVVCLIPLPSPSKIEHEGKEEKGG